MNKLIPVLAIITATAAHALPLDFEGGSGSPVTVTLDGKVDYTVTRAITDMRVVFVFSGGTPPLTDFASGSALADVNLFFTVNDAPYAFQLTDRLGTRFGGNTALGFDSVESVTLRLGDVVTLWGGSATTVVDIYGTVPTGGDLSTMLVPMDGTYPVALSGTYSAVPEPSTFAALAGLSVLTLAATRRRNR